jgi:hypothetical protein
MIEERGGEGIGGLARSRGKREQQDRNFLLLSAPLPLSPPTFAFSLLPLYPKKYFLIFSRNLTKIW